MHNVLKKIILNTQEKYYRSIDEMPIYNWIKCTEGKLEYTRISDDGTKSNDHKSWEFLYNEYLNKFGIGERYEKYLIQQQKLAILQADYVITRKKFTLTKIEMAKTKIKNLEVFFSTGQKIETILVWISKYMGYRIDPKLTSVTEYFTLLEHYGKANKKV